MLWCWFRAEPCGKAYCKSNIRECPHWQIQQVSDYRLIVCRFNILTISYTFCQLWTDVYRGGHRFTVVHAELLQDSLCIAWLTNPNSTSLLSSLLESSWVLLNLSHQNSLPELIWLQRFAFHSFLQVQCHQRVSQLWMVPELYAGITRCLSKSHFLQPFIEGKIPTSWSLL